MFKKNRSGFTLVELLVVIAIIGVLVTITLFGMKSIRERARDVQITSDISRLSKAIVAYSIENNSRYPLSNNDGLSVEALIYNNPINGYISDTSAKLVGGHYIESIPINKAYNKPYRYWSNGEIFNLKGYIEAQKMVFFEAYTDMDNKDDVKYRNVKTDIAASLGWTTGDKQMWIDNTTTVDGTVTVELGWRAVSGYNGPYTYVVKYQPASPTYIPNIDWGSAFSSDLIFDQRHVTVSGLDPSAHYDFMVVAYDMAGKNTEGSSSNPTLLNANFSDTSHPEGLNGSLMFIACAKIDRGMMNCPYSFDIEDNQIKVETNTIECNDCNTGGHDQYSTQFLGAKLGYRKVGETVWNFVATQRDPSTYVNGSYPMYLSAFVPAGRYELKLWAVNRNGNMTQGVNRDCYDRWNEQQQTLGSAMCQRYSPSPYGIDTVVLDVGGKVSGDFTPPAFPSNPVVTATKISNDTYRFNWPEAIDDTEVDHYNVTVTASRTYDDDSGHHVYNYTHSNHIFYNNVASMSGITANYTLSGVTTDIRHTITITAEDINGNTSSTITTQITLPR